MKKKILTPIKSNPKERKKICLEEFLQSLSSNNSNEQIINNQLLNDNTIFLMNKEYLNIFIDDSDLYSVYMEKNPFINDIAGLFQLKFEKDLLDESKSEYLKDEISLYSRELENKEFKYYILKRNWLMIENSINVQVKEYVEQFISINFTEYEIIKRINQTYLPISIGFNIIYFIKHKTLCIEMLMGHIATPFTSIDLGNNSTQIWEVFNQILRNICILENFQVQHEYIKNSASIIQKIADKYLLINIDLGMKPPKVFLNQFKFESTIGNILPKRNSPPQNLIFYQTDLNKARTVNQNSNPVYDFGVKLMDCLKSGNFSDIKNNQTQSDTVTNINDDLAKKQDKYQQNEGDFLWQKLYKIALICINNNSNPLNANELMNIYLKLNEKDFDIDWIDQYYKKLQNCKIETLPFLKQVCYSLKERNGFIENRLNEFSCELNHSKLYCHQLIEENMKMKQFIELKIKENNELFQQVNNLNQLEKEVERLQIQLKEKTVALIESQKKFEDEHLFVKYLEQQINDEKLLSQKRIEEKKNDIHELQLKIDDLKNRNLKNSEKFEVMEKKYQELEENNNHLKAKMKSRKEILKDLENEKSNLMKENEKFSEANKSKSMELTNENEIIKGTIDLLKIDDELLKHNVSKNINNLVEYILGEYTLNKEKLEKMEEKVKKFNNQDQLYVDQIGVFSSLDNNKNIHYYGSLVNDLPEGIGILFTYDNQQRNFNFNLKNYYLNNKYNIFNAYKEECIEIE